MKHCTLFTIAQPLMRLIMENTTELLRKAFVDVLEGIDGPNDIQRQTGLPQDRCEAIYNLYLLAQLGTEALPTNSEYAIKVKKGNVIVGYIACFGVHEEKNRIKGVEGLTPYVVRELNKIINPPENVPIRIPYFLTRQSCLETLATFDDSFHNEYQWEIEEVKPRM